jgi:hypothetical protein
MTTPTATRRRTTPNGVRLIVESRPRELKTSNRWDARIKGHDFQTIYTIIALDLPDNQTLTLVDTFSLDDIERLDIWRNEDYHAIQDLTAALEALGSPDTFAAVWADILETRAALQDIDPASKDRRARNHAEIERATQHIKNKLTA